MLRVKLGELLTVDKVGWLDAEDARKRCNCPTVGSVTCPILLPSTSSSVWAPTLMRAASAFVYGSPILGCLMVWKRCPTREARSCSSGGAASAPSPGASSNHASGGKPIALAMALIFS